MNKEELFKKYNIDESHKEWDNQADSWFAVEVYRAMHQGNLPDEENTSIYYIIEFLDKVHSNAGDIKEIVGGHIGSCYLTAKRMVYRHADQLLLEINS